MEVWQWISAGGGLLEAVLLVRLLEMTVGFRIGCKRVALAAGIVVFGAGNVFFYESFLLHIMYLLVVATIYCRLVLQGSVWLHEGIVLGIVLVSGTIRTITMLGMKLLANVCKTVYSATVYEVALLVLAQKAVGIMILTFLLVRTIYGSKQLALENAFLTEKIYHQQTHVLQIETDYYNARKLRHDINKTLNLYMRLLEDGRVEQVIKNMKEQLGKISEDKVVMLPGNNILSAVLNEKMSICKNHEIEFGLQLTAEIDSEREMNVAIMLSNLLDNAIENQLESKRDAKIFVNIFEQNSMYNMIVKNTISQSVLAKNPRLATQKADQFAHGLGLKSVKDTVEKYDGIIDFDEDCGQFIVHVAIPVRRYANV